ncbi:MAG: type II toxin-antitoxin system antitoxin DNA ADP-ribosyl glycohydrolase DarG, partial [Gammaproteobacteria bacterium]
MISYKQGNILDEPAQALVNTVNCVGVMGRGIALEFKHRFPENFKFYAQACKNDEVQPGSLLVYETGSLYPPQYIINFPSKSHWRAKSRMADIEAGLQALAYEINNRGIRSIAIPPLGCGLGGLDWSDVRPRIEHALKDIADDVQISVFEPSTVSRLHQVMLSKVRPQMTAGRAALLLLINRYLRGLMDPTVTLLEVHKLLYFMQEAGQPLRLQYKKSWYGPFAENLGHVLRAIEGHFTLGYLDGGDSPSKQITLLPGAVEEAQAYLNTDAEAYARFERVSNLVAGFESPVGL